MTSLHEITQELEDHIQYFPLAYIQNFSKIFPKDSTLILNETNSCMDQEGKLEQIHDNTEAIQSPKSESKELYYDESDSCKNYSGLQDQSKKIRHRRKIPKKALDILKGWLQENMHDPYPSNEVKKELAKKTQLEFKQVFV